MGWTDPPTFTSGAPLTAAQLNLFLRDNIVLEYPALATAAGQTFANVGSHKIATRQITNAVNTATQIISQTDYTGGANGPALTVTTGMMALAFWAARLAHQVSNDAQMFSSLMVTGDTEMDLTDGEAQIVDGQPVTQYCRSMQAYLFHTLTPGSNTFTMTYRVASGNMQAALRELIVWPF